MPDCPTCNNDLRSVRQREGLYFFCDQCGGRAVTLPQIRRMAGDKFASRMLVQINRSTVETLRACPFCSQKMKQLLLPDPPLALEACKHCGTVWFDATEFEAVPEGVVESTDSLILRGRESLAVEQINTRAEEERRQAGGGAEPPEEKWKWAAAFIGLPVSMDSRELTRWPWFTWGLSAFIALVSIVAFFDLKEAVETFGLIPAQVWRYGGITTLTSFFLHGGIWHLVGNLYFFILCGIHVEDYLGRWRMALLLLLATVTGDCFHVLSDIHSTDPCIGASGGISGVMVFYALQFPQARIGFLVRYLFRAGWISIPAWGAFCLWILAQLFLVYMQVNGISNVSALAHLGGVLAGFCLWLCWRKLATNLV